MAKSPNRKSPWILFAWTLVKDFKGFNTITK